MSLENYNQSGMNVNEILDARRNRAARRKNRAKKKTNQQPMDLEIIAKH